MANHPTNHIDRISIRNFQKHKRLVISPSPQVTTIVGPSDVGKSAIIRALRWVAFNRPGGTDFIHHGERTVSVSISTGHGVVCRKRSAKANIYKVSTDGEVVLRAIGSDVPNEVQRVLNLSDTNFQRQHDREFWLSETAGEVSRQLNQIVNLGIIDSTLANMASSIRTAKSTLAVVDSRIADAKEARRGLKWVRKANASLLALGVMEREITNAEGTARVLASLCKDASTCQDDSTYATGANVAANSTVVAGTNWREIASRASTLASLIGNAARASAVRNTPIPDLREAESAASSLKRIGSERESLGALVSEARNIGDVLCQLQQKQKTTESRLRSLMGNTCRLCGQTIPS